MYTAVLQLCHVNRRRNKAHTGKCNRRSLPVDLSLLLCSCCTIVTPAQVPQHLCETRLNRSRGVWTSTTWVRVISTLKANKCAKLYTSVRSMRLCWSRVVNTRASWIVCAVNVVVHGKQGKGVTESKAWIIFWASLKLDYISTDFLFFSKCFEDSQLWSVWCWSHISKTRLSPQTKDKKRA